MAFPSVNHGGVYPFMYVSSRRQGPRFRRLRATSGTWTFPAAGALCDMIIHPSSERVIRTLPKNFPTDRSNFGQLKAADPGPSEHFFSRKSTATPPDL